MFRRKLRCSFCGRTHADVGKLVSGHRAWICEECVALAQSVIDGKDVRPPRPYAGPMTLRVLVTKIVRRILLPGTHRLSTTRG